MSDGNLIYRSSAPYLFTVLIVALGWAFNNFVSNAVKSPIIEYKFIERNENGSHLLISKLKNISRETLFTNIEVMVNLKKNEIVGQPRIVIPPPTYLFGDRDAPEYTNRYARYKIPQLHPGAELSIVMPTTKGEVESYFHIACSNPVRLVQSGMLTFLLQNELLINFSIIIVLILCIVVYAVLLYRNRAMEGSGNGNTPC